MSLDTPTIYVIDDDPSFLSAVSRLIRISGYAVESLRSLSEFEAILPLSEPSCVLADVILAGESGLRAGEILAERGQRSAIIFMSATDNSEQIATASALGDAPCLSKPFEADDLFAALDAVLTNDMEARCEPLEHPKP